MNIKITKGGDIELTDVQDDLCNQIAARALLMASKAITGGDLAKIEPAIIDDTKGFIERSKAQLQADVIEAQRKLARVVTHTDTAAAPATGQAGAFSRQPDKPEHVPGSGETTGLMFAAIGAAILARGERVEFVDHAEHTENNACYCSGVIAGIMEHNGLKMEVFQDNYDRIYIRSNCNNPAVKQ